MKMIARVTKGSDVLLEHPFEVGREDDFPQSVRLALEAVRMEYPEVSFLDDDVLLVLSSGA